MKKYLILLFLASILAFSSCEKEEITPPTPPTQVEEEVTIFHKWLLIDGEMFLINLETNQKTMMKHFGPDRPVSSLRYSGVYIPIERIEQNVTTWEFTMPPAGVGQGEFILNGNYDNPMGFNITHSYMSITEHPTALDVTQQQLGGSARPITAYKLSSDTIIIQIHQAYESIGPYNYTYFSELKFVKLD